jgi:hypothetical protein
MGMVMTKRASASALGVALAVLLAVSGCGEKSDKTSDSSSSDKSSKSGSASASTSASASGTPTPEAASAGHSQCLDSGRLSIALGASFIQAGPPQVQGFILKCSYLGPRPNIFTYTVKSYRPADGPAGFRVTKDFYKKDLKRNGIDFDFDRDGKTAGIGEDSRYVQADQGITVATYSDSGVVLVATLNSPTPKKFKAGVFKATTAALAYS